MLWMANTGYYIHKKKINIGGKLLPLLKNQKYDGQNLLSILGDFLYRKTIVN